jgi:hypothetical protein
MQKLTTYIALYEPMIFPTRSFIKEITYWVTLLVASIVLLVNIVDTKTVTIANTKYFVQDIVASKEYLIAAIAMLIKHIVYTVDTFLLLNRKVARPLDFLTNVNHILFWVLIIVFGGLWTSAGCVADKNIVPCQYSNNGKIVYRDSRWPHIWIAALIKLIVDIVLFIVFQIVQKRRLSVAHGQTVSVIVLDIQYLLVCLWFNFNWSKPKATANESYDAKVLFIVIFIVGIVGIFFAIVCFILAYLECKGRNSLGRRNTTRTVVNSLMGLWWIIAFFYIFVFDATAGNVKSNYQILLFIMTLALIVIGLIYGGFNIWAKKNLQYTGHDLNNSNSRSFAGPTPQNQSVAAYSGQMMPQFRTHAEINN